MNETEGASAAVEARAIDADAWDRGLAALEHYVAVRHTADVSGQAMSKGMNLGQWVDSCRERYWASQLPAEQVAALENQPGWTWHGGAARDWRRSLLRLRRYAATHGPADISVDAVISGHRLGVWVNLQRSGYAAGALSVDRIALLEEISGWQWSELPRREQGLAILQEYVRAHGTADVPDAAIHAGFALGRWVTRQREDHRAGSLTAGEEAELQALPGWRWSATEERWRTGYGTLLAYVRDHGSAAVPQQTRIGDVALGSWVAECRRSFKSGSLPDPKVGALEALPGWQWSPQEEAWQSGFEILSRYLAASGHARPARTLRADGFPLGEWVLRQHKRHGAGRLSASRVAALESLPGWEWNEPPTETSRRPPRPETHKR